MPSAIASAIEAGKIKFGLVIPETAREQIEGGRQVTVQLYYNNASLTSRVKRRVSDVTEEFSESCRSRRLASLGLDSSLKREQLLNPVVMAEYGTADLREVFGERTGGMLPYVFIIFCFFTSTNS